MASSGLILIDTSILIDFFRKKNKEKSIFMDLSKHYDSFAISIITEYEILIGANESTRVFWSNFLENVIIFPFDKKVNQSAILIYRQLKESKMLIEIPDILIGATAVAHDLRIATLNTKHFSRINGLEII